MAYIKTGRPRGRPKGSPNKPYKSRPKYIFMVYPINKMCPTCKTVKDVTPNGNVRHGGFYINKYTPDGLCYECKVCVTDRYRENLKRKKDNHTPFSGALLSIVMDDQAADLMEICSVLVEQAKQGDLEAAKIIIERIEGKVANKINVSADDSLGRLIQNSADLLKKIRKDRSESNAGAIDAEYNEIEPTITKPLNLLENQSHIDNNKLNIPVGTCHNTITLVPVQLVKEPTEAELLHSIMGPVANTMIEIVEND